MVTTLAVRRQPRIRARMFREFVCSELKKGDGDLHASTLAKKFNRRWKTDLGEQNARDILHAMHSRLRHNSLAIQRLPWLRGRVFREFVMRLALGTHKAISPASVRKAFEKETGARVSSATSSAVLGSMAARGSLRRIGHGKYTDGA